jgi:M-phase inducer tyrosine phosphatase
MDIDDKENLNSTEATMEELFAGTPPPSISIKKNPTFRALHVPSHSMDASPSSGSDIDSPLCLNRFTSRFRPKPKVRRTLSMFQKPGDLLDTEMEETNHCTPPQLPCKDFMKTDECQILPCFGIKDDMLKRIDHKTVRLLGFGLT